MKKLMVLLLLVVIVASDVASAPSEKKEPKHNDRLAEADRLFNLGLKHRDRAWEYEQKASGTTASKDRDVYTASAEREYKLAIETYRSAVKLNSRHHEGFGSLGYALRKIGQYDEALKAYDRALKMKPNYAEALEYRAEAYLGLNRVDDVKLDYQRLVGLDKALARTFLTAAAEWSGTSEEFAVWVKNEKEKLGPAEGKTW
jgi:tetratricopeptide (TPR) repeat protein